MTTAAAASLVVCALSALAAAGPTASADTAGSSAGASPGLRRTFSLYSPVFLSPADTAQAARGARTPGAERPASMLSEALDVSGYKSIGVSIGSNGQASLEQGLDVTVTGRLGHRTELSAHIADQGTSLEGGTRELSQIDLVYVKLLNPRYFVTVGDQYVTWPAGGLLADSKKIKGFAAGLTFPRVRVAAFGAISGGKYTVQTIRGRDGLQGPYTLSGNGEADLISPVGGTVHVSVDGRALAEGPDADFSVDYDYGSITFSPRFLITNERIIRVEYEYKTFDYQRSLVGGDVGYATADSVFSVNGALWNEADNKDAPIDLNLSPEQVRELQQAGDSSVSGLVRVPVDARDVDSMSALYPLYEMVDTLGRQVLRYVPFCPANPQPERQRYWVHFRTVAQGQGDYAADTISVDTVQPGDCILLRAAYLGAVYRYVGPGRGSVAADNRLPMPQRTTQGEVRARLRVPGWLDLSADVAGLSIDRNEFSKDDGDNQGAAGVVNALFGRRDTEKRSLWASGGYSLITRNYTREVMGAYEGEEQWHTTGFDVARTQRESWTAGGGATLNRYLTLAGSYGELRRNGSLLTGRISASGRASAGEHVSLSYNGSFFQHTLDTLKSSQQDDLQLGVHFKQSEWSLGLADKWRRGATGHGDIGGSAGLVLKPIGLTERFTLTENGWGNGGPASFVDTGHTMLWEQTLELRPKPTWRLNASSTWHRRTVDAPSQTQSVVLVSLQNDLTSLHGRFITHEEYTLNSEQASALVQVPIYAGNGLGGFSYDSTRGSLVPSANGDYRVLDQEVYDNSTNATVRKSNLDITWSLRPRRDRAGILGDLTWRGELQLLEHVLGDSTSDWRSWVPGYLTIADRSPQAVRLANCYYEQRITWAPDSLAGWRAELRGRPYVKRSYTGREEGMEGRLTLERNRRPWFLALNGDVKHYTFAGTLSDTRFTVTDASADPTQKYLFPVDIGISLAETGGWASKAAESGWYFLVRPALSWEPKNKGTAEASYTFASVNIPGTLDYAMAQGFEGGITHRIDVHADVKMGEHFSLGASYRGQFAKRLGMSDYDKPLHVVSMEVKALL